MKHNFYKEALCICDIETARTGQVREALLTYPINICEDIKLLLKNVRV